MTFYHLSNMSYTRTPKEYIDETSSDIVFDTITRQISWLDLWFDSSIVGVLMHF